MAHLEEESTDKEEYIDNDDPDDLRDITEEFIICLTRAVKDTQQVEKCCDSPDHFIHDCPLQVGVQVDPPLNWGDGMALRKEAQATQGKVTMPKVPQDVTPQA